LKLKNKEVYFMKNVVRNMLLSVLISLSACLSLITCANPMSGVNEVIGNGGGLITVTIGGENARKTVTWANALDSSELTHEITVFGGEGGPHNGNIPSGGGTVSFSVIPGEWTISVKAYYGDDLVAVGSESKQISKGNNPTVHITMREPPNYSSYVVTFDANGGSFEKGLERKTENVKKYSKATYPEPDPTNGGLYFIEWYTDSDCTDGNQYNFHTPVKGEITLYAKWSAERPFTVTFNRNHSDNGGWTDADPTTKHALSGGTVTLPEEPTRTGYTFVGWFTSGDEPFTAETNVTDDITVYAKWTADDLVNASPPVINVQPVAINEIYLTDTVELTVSATSSDGGNITFQWYSNTANNTNGTPIGNATSATYITPNTLAKGNHYYYCIVKNTKDNVNGTNSDTVTSHVAMVTVYGVGSGTEQDPFLVHNVITLEKVGKGEGTGEWAGWSLSAHYKQIKNIILPDPDPGQSNWTPIGTNVEDMDLNTLEEIPVNSFTGSYDGNGKTISNLKINAPGSDYWHPQGLFGCIGSRLTEENVGVVKNVGIVNCDITSYDGYFGYIGGVVGKNHYAVVQNCYSTGNVSGTGDYVGGVVGYNKNGIVQNCYSTGDVSGRTVGGVVGDNNYGTVQNCYATGNVSGTEYVGGVVGLNYDTVEYCYSTGDVSGNSGVGGVVGLNYDTVEYCYSTGDVSGNSGVGGVVGGNGSSNGSTVQNCYATGTVSGNSGVGGVAGAHSDGRVQDCYSTGIVSGNNYVGGVVGKVGTNGHVQICYSTGIVSGYDYVGGVIGGSTSYGAFELCLALNPSITKTTGPGDNFGRVSGSACDKINNYANSDMMTVGWERTNDEKLDGKDVTLPTVESWWKNPYTWSEWGSDYDIWDFSSVWEWDSVTKLPKLRGVGGQ
jgi:uncharacterized repeat protein (TIGR02543 family)